MKTIFSEFKKQALNAKLGRINVLVSPVASGKSYAITEQIANYCIEEMGIELIVISQPLLSIWKDEDKERLKQKGLVEYKSFEEVSLEVMNSISSGTFQKGFILTTPNTLGEYIKSSKNDLPKKILKFLGDKAAVFIDEVHYHSVSCYNNYEFCKGKATNKNNQFKFFNKGLLAISKYTKNFWGFSATPHKEIVNQIYSELEVDYRDVTTDRKNRLIWSKLTDVVLLEDDFESIRSKALSLINFNFSSNQDKKTAMFQCRTQKSWKFTLKEVLIEVCKRIPEEYRNEKLIIVDTSESTYSISPKEILEKEWEFEREIEIIDQEEVYRRLQSPECSEQLLFCVEKHQLGSNIPTLSEIFSFKEFNYEYKGDIYIDKLIQLYGRGVRVNLPQEYSDYSRNLYELYTSLLEEGELERILDLNKCTINLIKNPYTEYFKEWHSESAVTPEFVRNILENLK